MLAAFTAEPIIELKQRDKSKIESILIHGDLLLVGLNTGALRIYRINNGDGQRANASNTSDQPVKDSVTESSKPSDLLREHEKFAKSKIEQLAIFKEANILISLSNGLISLHDLGSYELHEQLSKAKGASLFAATSNIVNDANTSVPILVSRLAVAVRRRLLIWSWQDGELTNDVQEIALSNSIKSLTWATGTKVVVGLNSNFILLDIETEGQKVIVGPGSIGGNPGQERGAGTLSYIGMASMIPLPLATGLGEDEMLLAKDVNTHFINRNGDAIGRKQIPWRTAPQAIGYSYPYLLALSDTSKGTLEVRNPQTLNVLQSVELANANLLQVPNPNISLAHQGKGFLVASDRVIWRMKGLHYDAQVDALVESGLLDEAISLLSMIEETLINDKAGRLREIKMQKAQKLFDEGKYRNALELFSEVSAPPERVIKLYPESFAGDLSQSLALSSQANSPKKKRAESTISKTSNKSGKRLDVETTSLAGTEALHRNLTEVPENELKEAVRELQAYLADIRRRLQRFFNSDQSVKDISEVRASPQAEDNEEFLRHVLNKSTIDDEEDLSTKLIDVATVVDTTLFRVQMYATPSLVGPLLRISNFCAAEVVMNRLEESERYNDLIDFLYGKRLHRQALERLQKFGQSKKTDEIDPSLHGPRRTVSYLQSLPAESIDLIFEFSQWPMESDPATGMEIFIADTENAESLPRTRVFEFLESINKPYATRYLEHVIEDLDDATPELHHNLAVLYLENLKEQKEGSEKHETQAKLLSHLRDSSQYSPAKILALLPRDDPTFFEATAVVFQRMGQHRQALQVYVFKLKDPAKAEEYCNQIYLQEALNSEKEKKVGSKDREKSSGTAVTADPTDEKLSVYATLLGLYLDPPSGEEARIVDAIALMAKHGARLPASSTLDMIPPDLLVKELEFYFRGRIRNANTTMNDARIQAAMMQVESWRIQAKLLFGQGQATGKGGRSRAVRIDDDRVCGVCHKRLGSSVISVFPDNSVVHLGCASRREKELSDHQR